jgi:putative transposase
MDTHKYKTSAHTKYDIRIHLVWITKYRYKVITVPMGKRLIEMIRTICKNQNIQIISGNVSAEHVHLYLSIPPLLSVSKIAQLIKGISSNKMMQEFPELEKRYWGRHFWARGYFVSTVGTIDNETIQNYIKNHTSEDIDDYTFTITIQGSK